MFGLAYSSQAISDFDEELLMDLADRSAEKNEKRGISGYLYFRNNLFLQYLEGEQQTVENLMSKISQDPRHKVLTSVTLPDISERIFPHWYMRFLGSDLPQFKNPTLEDELLFILETTAKEHYSSPEVADAIVHVTQRIAHLDW